MCFKVMNCSVAIINIELLSCINGIGLREALV